MVAEEALGVPFCANLNNVKQKYTAVSIKVHSCYNVWLVIY